MGAHDPKRVGFGRGRAAGTAFSVGTHSPPARTREHAKHVVPLARP